MLPNCWLAGWRACKRPVSHGSQASNAYFQGLGLLSSATKTFQRVLNQNHNTISRT
jgi:hypothetical protein